MTHDMLSNLRLEAISLRTQRGNLCERFKKSLKMLQEIAAPISITLPCVDGYHFSYEGGYDKSSPTIRVRKEGSSEFFNIHDVSWDVKLMMSFLSKEEELIQLIKKEMEAEKKAMRIFTGSEVREA